MMDKDAAHDLAAALRVHARALEAHAAALEAHAAQVKAEAEAAEFFPPYDDDAYQAAMLAEKLESRHLDALAENVECPTCAAGIGRQCVTASGRTSWTPHAARATAGGSR